MTFLMNIIHFYIDESIKSLEKTGELFLNSGLGKVFLIFTELLFSRIFIALYIYVFI